MTYQYPQTRSVIFFPSGFANVVVPRGLIPHNPENGVASTYVRHEDITV